MNLLTKFICGQLDLADFEDLEVETTLNPINGSLKTVTYAGESNELICNSATVNSTNDNYKIWNYSGDFPLVRIEGRISLFGLIKILSCSGFGPELIIPSLHHISNDIASCRIGMHVPTYTSSGKGLAQQRLRRSFINRPFRGKATNSSGFKWLSRAHIEQNEPMLIDPKIYRPFRNATIIVSGTVCDLDYKSFSNAEEFIDFQEAFSEFFFNNQQQPVTTEEV